MPGEVDEQPGMPPVYGPFVRVTIRAWVRWDAVLVIKETGTVSEVTVRPNSGIEQPRFLSEYPVKDLIDALMTAKGNDE
jgi:hypothetical protein